MKPCPFCGGDALLCEDDRACPKYQADYMVVCTECEASTCWYESEEIAKQKWNQRFECL